MNHREHCCGLYKQTQSAVFILRHLVSYISVWHVQTAAIIRLELDASVSHTYSVIPPFTCYMVHFTPIFPYVCIIYPALRLLFIPSFPFTWFMQSVALIFISFQLLWVLTSFLPCLQSGITPSLHSIVAHFLPEGPCFLPLSKNQARALLPNVKSHLKSRDCSCMCNPKRPGADLIWQKTRIQRGISKNVQNMLQCFFFQEGQMSGGWHHYVTTHTSSVDLFHIWRREESILLIVLSFHYSIWR